jgi:hypothetical protein
MSECFRCDKPIKNAKDVFCKRCWTGIKKREEARKVAAKRRAEWRKANPEEVAIEAAMREFRSMDREAARKHVQWLRRQREFDAMPRGDQLYCARYVLAVCPATAKSVMSGTMTLADAYDEVTAMPVHQQLLLSLIAKHDPDAIGGPEAQAHIEAELAAIAEGAAPMSTIPLFALCEAVVTNVEAA